jgi:hypothetical protein
LFEMILSLWSRKLQFLWLEIGSNPRQSSLSSVRCRWCKR